MSLMFWCLKFMLIISEYTKKRIQKPNVDNSELTLFVVLDLVNLE